MTSDDTRTMRERMLAGDLYLADDPELEEGMRRAGELAERYQREFNTRDPKAADTLKELIPGLGENVFVRPPVFVDYGTNITVGANSYFNYHCTLLDVVQITIGADCLFGPGVQLLTPSHPIDPEQRRAKWEAAKPITIGDNVWIGGGAIVCPGVTIGDNSIIGAGAVVTKDIPAGVLAVGNPAKVIREL